MKKREIVRDFLDNKIPERVPTSFWYHFVSFHNHYNWEEEKVYNDVLEGQKKYIDEVKPDLLKIMSDGFFGHPSVASKKIETVEDLSEIKSVGANDPWITEQVKFVKEICEYAGEEVYKFYNIFSPLQYIRLRFEEYDEDFEKFVRLFNESPETMVNAANKVAEDIKILIKKIFEETNVNGIYYSVQAVQDDSFDEQKHKELVEPLDLLLLEEINKYSEDIILHICGYANYTNNLEWYSKYPVKAFNWATHTENIDLEQGKRIFNDKPVLGGFDNNQGSVLYEGTEEELRQEIYSILDKAGVKGVALGADCTISSDISPERLEMIKKIAKGYVQK